MSAPTYCGNGKKHHKFDGVISVGFSAAHLKILQDNLNEQGWVNVLISPQREHPEKYSVKIDDWKPNSRADERQEQERQSFQADDPIEQMHGHSTAKTDGMPF